MEWLRRSARTQLWLPKPEMSRAAVLPDPSSFSWCLGDTRFSREGCYGESYMLRMNRKAKMLLALCNVMFVLVTTARSQFASGTESQIHMRPKSETFSSFSIAMRLRRSDKRAISNLLQPPLAELPFELLDRIFAHARLLHITYSYQSFLNRVAVYKGP